MHLHRGLGRSRRLRTRISLLVLGSSVLTNCSSERVATAAGELSGIARSRTGMVVSGSGPATMAGVEILEAGGNAFDAAVAVGFALAVSEPTQSGLGGRTQGIWRTASGDVGGVDATTEVPARFDPAQGGGGDYGWAAVATPGTVAGLARLHEGRGTLPWARVLEPAIRLAQDGFPLSPGEADRLASAAAEFREDAGARRHFLRPDASPFQPGDTLRQAVLAETLRRLAVGGADEFYRGSLAEVIGVEMGEHGGLVSRTDLGSYQARPAMMGHGRYGDLEIWGSYLPASGLTTIEALQILDRVELSEPGGAEWTSTIGHALLMAFADREGVVGIPEDVASEITSPELADRRADELRGILAHGLATTTVGPELEYPNTTHISVVDADGAAVSLTQSLGPTGGARVASERLGFIYASTLGYLDGLQPGARPWSSQSPVIALRGGRLAYVLGGAGARRIISALVSTLVRLGDGADLETALAAPRFHPADGRLTLEVGTGADDTGWLASDYAVLGFDVGTAPFGVYFARLNAICLDATSGELVGVGDPRWPWSAAAGPGAT